MKKIAIIAAACMLFANAAFASGELSLTLGTTPSTGKSVYGVKGTGTTATAIPSALIGKSSTGVGVGMNTVANGYSVITQHVNGTKAYGSAHSSTSIFVHNIETAGTAVDTGTAAADAAEFTTGNGWTSL